MKIISLSRNFTTGFDKPNNNFLRIILLFAFFAAFCFSAAAQKSEIKCSLELNGRMLDVRLEMPANAFDKTAFSLSDWAGQTNYADNIYRVAAKDKKGNALKTEKTGARSWTVENRKKPFTLAYTVVAQKEDFMGGGARNHFHPTIFESYAFLWGNTFLFHPDEKTLAALPVRLEIFPHEYARFYSNFAESADSFSDLSELFIAAGDYRVVEKTIGGRRVRFLINGEKWKFTDEQFAETVAQIIEAQVRYIGFSPSAEDLLITLNEGAKQNQGGTVVKNVISVYPDPQAGLRDFETLRLIAHEHFHFWNGNVWRAAPGKGEGYYKWMSEGFTEYYAGLTLYRENLITEKQFVAWLNRLLLDYQTNPVAFSATAEILAENYWKSNDYNKLPYVKGALLGFLTDLKIRRKTSGAKQIDDLMRLLMSRTDREKGFDDAILLTNFDAISQTDNRAFYDDHMLGAKLLPVAETLKNSGIAAAPAPHEVFDLGFSTENGQMMRGAKIIQITSPGAAEAGLKAGDALQGYSFSYGRPHEQASFTVTRNGEAVHIKYYPKKTVDILQIDENAKIVK